MSTLSSTGRSNFERNVLAEIPGAVACDRNVRADERRIAEAHAKLLGETTHIVGAPDDEEELPFTD
jgi:hypothetical protein